MRTLHTFYRCIPLRTFAYLGVPLHSLADLCLRTFTYLSYMHTLTYFSSCTPVRTLAYLDILLAENTIGTPKGAQIKLLRAGSLIIYIPLLCLPSILALFSRSPLRTKKAISRNSLNVHTYDRHFIQYVKTQRSTANPSMPRTTQRAHREHSAHDVLVLWYKDFLTDSEYLIS